MLASEVTNATLSGFDDPEIGGIAYDSRAIEAGMLFVAMRGEVADGHRFIPQVVESGAAAVMAETEPDDDKVAWLQVPDSRKAMAELANAFYGVPSNSLRVAGVTGTNGKTTTGFLIQHLVKSSYGRCGLVGTVQYDDGVELLDAARTTPESLDLQGLLARMRDNGCAGAVMEVSSHALEQSRASGVQFDVGVFTNLTQDHLDYHGTMDAYYSAKRLLFEQMAEHPGEKTPVAVINIDDKYGKRLAEEFQGRLRVITFGMGAASEFRASDIRSDMNGTQFQLNALGRSFLVRLPLIGNFNVSNALAALSSAYAMGLNLRESINYLADSPQVPGRLEAVRETRPFKVFVDYAHTPDALENALKTVRKLSPRRLITVFGCGGDRDREKRRLMARVAAQLSDYVLITSDNPRTEDPQKILDEIVAGFSGSHREVIEDRRDAIGRAIDLAGERDIVVIAGKGHETYQEFADGRIEFDDRIVASQFMRDWEPIPIREDTEE